MRFSLLVIVGLLITGTGWAQLKTTALCPPLQVDIMAGKINKLHPRSVLGEIKNTLTCTSEIVEESDGTVCKGIFFKDLGVYFFTERNYFEIRNNFAGTMTPKLMGAPRTGLFSLLGYPKLKDATWDAFQMEYGLLILYYDKAGKINKIQISSKSVDNIKLCE